MKTSPKETDYYLTACHGVHVHNKNIQKFVQQTCNACNNGR